MVQHVRNFWVSASVDGRVEPVGFGPHSPDGGFSLTVTMRDRGEIRDAVVMRGYVDNDGRLCLWCQTDDGEYQRIRTER